MKIVANKRAELLYFNPAASSFIQDPPMKPIRWGNEVLQERTLVPESEAPNQPVNLNEVSKKPDGFIEDFFRVSISVLF